ncbi:sigma-54 interaction domain-containing protein [Desulfobacterium sp. N47]
MFEQELNRHWKTVIDTILDGVMIVDKAGNIVFVNKAFESITGYPYQEVIGKSCMLLACDTCEVFRQTQDDIWCELFKTGTLDMRRCRLTRKDGRHVDVIKNASVLRDLKDKVMGAVETITDITEIIKKDTRITALRDQLCSENGFQGMLGASVAIERVFELISNVATSDAPIIIFGESGTGKELVARAIHDIGQRKNKPFVKVNCAALNESLLESELFGHVKGAFTGAHKGREGRFEAAHGGDIFLDEIGDLPLITQIKLLRVLEEKTIERVGDNKPIRVDVRIITATNKNLETLVKNGSFREDLFYRINVIPIYVPPLRKRREDIPLFVDHSIQRIRLKTGKDIKGIDDNAMRLLMTYEWPGNIRELKSAFEYAAVSCQESIIKPHNFPPNIYQQNISPVTKSKKSKPDRIAVKKTQIIEALKQADGNQSEAARILGISRVTVWSRMKRFDIQLKREAKI